MYLNFFNLTEEPFRLTSDPKFFHLAEPHATALATLVDAVKRRKGFVVLTGQIGTGKTTVLHTALQILAEKEAVGTPIASAFVLNPLLKRDEFLETVVEEFEISCPSTSKPARLAALRDMMLEMQRKGGTSVLLVDEAHLLNTDLLEEIRLLSGADTYQEKLLQIVLCGQPELLTLLRRPDLRALRQRIASSCTLRPFTAFELRSYVAERMYAAGFHGDKYPFPTATLEDVFRFSKGVPRLINLLCDACLAIGFKKQRSLISTDIVEAAAADLELNDKRSVPPVQELIPVPNNVADLAVSTQSAAPKSALDLLIQGMKQRRTSVME
jgi:general secretion pathway protein A